MVPVIVCPLRGKCEDIKENVLYRCAWFTKLVGKDPQSEKDIEEWGCAISWLPIMLVEVAQTNRGTSESVVSLRDETIKRQDIFNVLTVEGLKRQESRTFEIEN